MRGTDLKERIRKLQAELAPLMAEHRMNLLSAALQRLHAMGVDVAVLEVNADGTPRLNDGALDFFVRSCPPDRRSEVAKLLDDLSDEHACLFLCDVDEQAVALAFGDDHFEWSSAEQRVVVRWRGE
jgi:hypothetical protein